jgi:hypothetical protein
MKFLSLAQGDPIGKDLLHKLVDARYGAHPPAMDALRVTYAGRSRAKLGPFSLWARVDAVATHRFPTLMKWSFKIRVLRFLRSSYTTCFDGETVYEAQGGRVTRSQDAEAVESARRRAWAETIFYVSPLIANDRVRVQGIDPHAFKAHLAGAESDVAIVRLDENNTLREIEIERLDPAAAQYQKQFLRPVGKLITIDGLILPETVRRYWGDEMIMELSPVRVEMNPALSEGEFVLKDLLSVLDDEAENEEAANSGAAV